MHEAVAASGRDERCVCWALLLFIRVGSEASPETSTDGQCKLSVSSVSVIWQQGPLHMQQLKLQLSAGSSVCLGSREARELGEPPYCDGGNAV